MPTQTTEVKWCSFSALPIGASFRYQNAINLGLDEVQKKVSDTEMQRIKPISDFAYAAPVDELLLVTLLEYVPDVQPLVKTKKQNSPVKRKRKAKAKA